MKVNPNIFKEYDIRGKYPQEINAKVAYWLGRSFVKFLKPGRGGKIVVARDKRPSSPKLVAAFIAGVLDAGIDVLDIGEATTPMLYFSVPFLKAKGGAMVTASHLAKNHNGIKFVGEKAKPISGLEIKQTLGQLTSDVNKKNIRCRLGGALKKFNIKKDYLKAMLGDCKLNKKIPFSYSFDFDGDRLIIKNFRGDIIGGIIGDSILKKGDKFVYDLRCSRRIPEYFENKGITAIPCRVGHFNIKKLMREKRAVFGMELTGHYYFKEFSFCESPLYGLRILIEQLEKTGKTLGELAKPFMKYSHSGIINIPISNIKSPARLRLSTKSQAGGQISNLIQQLKEKYKNGAQNNLDGLTAEFSNWWFNIRPSHTEPLVRLVIEANTPKLLEQKKKELFAEIKKKKGKSN
jgi:phosphomannomutase